MAKMTLEEKYKKLGLTYQSQTVLNAMKQFNPKQYENYMKREKLILSGKYNTHKREIFVKNLLTALEKMKEKYGDVPLLDENETDSVITYDTTIQTLIDNIKKVQFRDWDMLSPNFSMFMETYSEDVQQDYDFAIMQDMYRQLADFQQSDYFKKHQRKGQFKYTTLSNKGLGIKTTPKTKSKIKRKSPKHISVSLNVKVKKPKYKDKYNK